MKCIFLDDRTFDSQDQIHPILSVRIPFPFSLPLSSMRFIHIPSNPLPNSKSAQAQGVWRGTCKFFFFTSFSTMFARPLACRAIRSYATKRQRITTQKDAIDLSEAFRVLKALEVGHPEHQIEAHVQCKIEKSTPLIRGSVILSKSIKQEPTVLVFATGKKAEEAKAAGAQLVGGEELIEQVKAGQVKFDKCIATPQMFPLVTKIAKVLGPKGLMPTVKKGRASGVKVNDD